MKVIVGMATMQGREQQCRKAIASLMNNTVRPDDLILYDNSIEPIDLTDNGKFFGLSLYTEPVYYLSADDDLIYSPEYIQRTIQAIDHYQCIVTYHGRILKGEGLHYYRGHKSLRFQELHHRDLQIDICGTGVTGFRTDLFNPVGIHAAEDKKMSDLVFSLEAAKQKQRIMFLAHRSRFIQAQEIPSKDTIMGQHIDNCTRQGQLADDIYRLNRMK